MPTYGLFLTHSTREGYRDGAHAVWHRHMAPEIEANPNHLAYFYCFDLDDRNVIRVFQQYRSAEDAAAFLESDAYARYLDEVDAFLIGPPEVHPAEPLWTKPTADRSAAVVADREPRDEP